VKQSERSKVLNNIQLKKERLYRDAKEVQSQKEQDEIEQRIERLKGIEKPLIYGINGGVF